MAQFTIDTADPSGLTMRLYLFEFNCSHLEKAIDDDSMPYGSLVQIAVVIGNLEKALSNWPNADEDLLANYRALYEKAQNKIDARVSVPASGTVGQGGM